MMSQIPLFIINEVILYRLLDTRYSYAKNTSFFYCSEIHVVSKMTLKEKNGITKNVNYFLGFGIIRSIYPRQTQISVTFAIILYDFSLFYRNLGHHW